MKLPKMVTKQFNEVEKKLRKDQPLIEEQTEWLKGMQMTEESLQMFLPDIQPRRHPLMLHYYHCDQVDTPVALISDTGGVDWAAEYDPFGNKVAEGGQDRISQPIRIKELFIM